jgi:anti-sigma regulatory factor (Ser/Thr protein kinase)
MTAGGQTFVHEALLYSDLGTFLEGTTRFLREGIANGEPALAAVPAPRLSALGDALGEDAQHVKLVDMGQLGRNPSRILPAIAGFIEQHADRHVRFVGEPSWPGRRDCEAIEAARHEALINYAFADADASILCPYDTSLLDEARLRDAERTHPCMVCGDETRASADYTDPLEVWAALDRPLDGPVAPLTDFVVDGDVGVARRMIRPYVRAAGLDDERVGVLLLAASEAVTNGLIHANPPVRLTLWRDERELVCDVTDAGQVMFTDPLAGRRRPTLEATSGRGLWIINQLCDLTEVRSGADGTTVRMRMELAEAA